VLRGLEDDDAVRFEAAWHDVTARGRLRLLAFSLRRSCYSLCFLSGFAAVLFRRQISSWEGCILHSIVEISSFGRLLTRFCQNLSFRADFLSWPAANVVFFAKSRLFHLPEVKFHLPEGKFHLLDGILSKFHLSDVFLSKFHLSDVFCPDFGKISALGAVGIAFLHLFLTESENGVPCRPEEIKKGVL